MKKYTNWYTQDYNFACYSVRKSVNAVTLRAEGKLKVLDNRVLRNLFGSKRQKVAEHCTKFRDKMFHNLQISLSIVS